MAVSIEIAQEVIDAFEKVSKKLGKYAIFKADDTKTKAILEFEGGLDATFEQFKDALPDNLPRWAVFDLHIEKDDGSTCNKIVFYNYVPDNYTGMDKLFYSASKDSIVKELEGVAKSIQANDKDDVDEKEAIENFL
mmetsp:Transcript_4903/g.5590  ORF Transcript_4903/g.5590 Transcript_4903/m.5590 type:complete len:136 (-) Transcript_4903:110-517(-)|eukprot:CAMPEP_0205799222 /NCGR_PEP_ID=MMETSP0205-20121125/412_1 /ASSEMBLY_ACC=CAM_ASM_000278 /TAXON_ID=36767 /ORGANISM="Euplotes focardii, Strain TN1" /LENGTH=135 /DNA_ID=CAMNT_0053060157 /DNA_START=17 /DNA_END=424 /DNA_ORIENTATION=+